MIGGRSGVRWSVQLSAAILAMSLYGLAVAAIPCAGQSVQPDIVFQHQTTGQAVDWLMNGTSLSHYAYLPASGAASWKIVGSGDFDGDTRPDLLYQNQQTGQLVYWLMNETKLIQSGFVDPSMPGPVYWKVVTVADLDGDHKPDILFQNQTTGQLVYWLMNGVSLIRYGFLTDPGSAGWRVVGAADLTGAGKTDILFQNQQTGTLVYWQMNGTSFVKYGYLTEPGSSIWKVAGIADFNNDGKVDILFQNQSTGQLVYWLMNRTALSNIGYIGPDNPGANWKVVVLWEAQTGSASGTIQ
jgi:aromatic ring-cleaving dioxygenase